VPVVVVAHNRTLPGRSVVTLFAVVPVVVQAAVKATPFMERAVMVAALAIVRVLQAERRAMQAIPVIPALLIPARAAAVVAHMRRRPVLVVMAAFPAAAAVVAAQQLTAV
jgi:hypothetical protein